MSEKNLEKLIATLKKEAIEAAEKEAGEILEKAHAEARNIVEEASSKSDMLLQQAEEEAGAIREKGEGALRQAARDMSVSARNNLLLMLKSVLESEVERSFTPELVETAVLKILENVGAGTTVSLPGELKAGLAAQILERFQSSQDRPTITEDTSPAMGFSIAKTDEGWSYHVSPEAVTELLYSQLSPSWLRILKKGQEP